jgi:hypothetical protein
VAVMVNFMCQLGCGTRCSGIWLNIILGVLECVFSE